MESLIDVGMVWMETLPFIPNKEDANPATWLHGTWLATWAALCTCDTLLSHKYK